MKTEGTIYLEAEEGQLSLRQGGFLTSGSAGCWKAEFTFTGRIWNGLSKTAVFTWQQDGAPKTLHLLLEGGTLTIPAALLAEPGAVYLGVFGIGAETIRLTTNFVRLDVREGSWSAQPPLDPLPDVYQQIIARLQEVSAQAQAVLAQAEHLSDMANARVDQAITASPLPSMAEISDLRLGTDGTRYGTAGEAVRRQLSALESVMLERGAAGSVTYGMLSQEVRECLTGGAAAVVGKDAVLAENLADKAVTPEKTTFFRKIRDALDPAVNLFDGEFRRMYLSGTTGKLTLAENEGGKLAVIEVQPNTSYSITLNLRTTLKVGSSPSLLSAGDVIDGGISVTVGTEAYQTVRTTGPNDRYLYVSVTNPTIDHLDDSEVYLKIIISDKAVLPAENEMYSAARYVPHRVDIYTRGQVDRLIGTALDSRSLKLRKEGQDFYISVPCSKDSVYTRYAYRRVDSDKINMHQWRLLKTDLVDEQDLVLYSLDTQTEWEGAVLETNTQDFIGGYPGNEINQSFSLFLDGRQIPVDGEDFTMRGREIRAISQSRLNRHSTDVPLFTRWKSLVWEAESRTFSVENKWKALQEVEVSQSKLCSVSCKYRDESGHPLAQFARKNDDYSQLDLSQPFSGFGGKEVTRFDLWGENSDGAFSLSIETDNPRYPNQNQYLSDFRSQERCKVYFDVTGHCRLQKDECVVSKAKIRVDFAPKV